MTASSATKNHSQTNKVQFLFILNLFIKKIKNKKKVQFLFKVCSAVKMHNHRVIIPYM